MAVLRLTVNPIETLPKWPPALSVARHVLVPSLRHVLRHVANSVSKQCELAFALVFPFCHGLRLHSFVFSALDSGEFKHFHDSKYRNLRELSRPFYMLTNTTLIRLGFGNSFILIAFVDKFQQKHIT